MLDLSPEKILILGLLALIVLGPSRLPQAARTVGHILGQLRRMSSSFQDEVRDALSEPAQALGAAAPEIRPLDVRRSLHDAVTNAFTIPPAPGQDQANRSTGPARDQVPVQSSPPRSPATPPTFPPAAPDDPSLN